MVTLSGYIHGHAFMVDWLQEAKEVGGGRFARVKIIKIISGSEYVKNFTNFSCQRDDNFISIRSPFGTELFSGGF
jgi:hypothetical protein